MTLCSVCNKGEVIATGPQGIRRCRECIMRDAHAVDMKPVPVWIPEARTDSNWIQTYTGRQFWPLNPDPSEVCIADIAHALSNTCRYTGHSLKFYSVAEHSVRVSYRVAALWMAKYKPTPWRTANARTAALCGLLHDASEAYIADVSRPVKHSATFGPIYKAIEANLERVICLAFDLPLSMAIVKQADNELLATERRDLMAEPPRPWSATPQPLPRTIEPWTPEYAEAVFLYRFHALKLARSEAELEASGI